MTGGTDRLLHPSLVHVISGTVSGVLSAAVVHPIDLIKTRLQAQERWSGSSVGRPQYHGTMHAVRSIMQQEGWQGLYKGISPALLGSGSSWGLYFLAYNWFKKSVEERLDRRELSAPWLVGCGIASGVVVTSLTHPIWLVKTRLQLDFQRERPLYGGISGAFRHISRTEGVLGLWRGYIPSLLLTVHGALQFMAYELINRVFQSLHHGRIPTVDGHPTSDRHQIQLGPVEHFTSGFLSKVFASFSTYPYSLVKTRLQDIKNSRNAIYRGLWDATLKIYRHEGWMGFYKGVVPNTLKVAPSTAVTFVAYEQVSRLLHHL